ncbi:uncharacterized protein LOC123320481 [Coccinella septempunctata]|uniref:uncharacterized protein LOC123320481 n=1 Tax=Coccinella septempunctata TaxID=41139 RepID=UPI001D0654AC|nr:uncharacterized protein LOC123320481 [Coccinella septempunctata]
MMEGPRPEMESEHIECVTNTDVIIPLMEETPEMESKQLESVISNTDDIPLRAPVGTSHSKKFSKSLRRDKKLQDMKRTINSLRAKLNRRKSQICYCKGKPVKPVLSSKKTAIFQLINESKKFLSKEAQTALSLF